MRRIFVLLVLVSAVPQGVRATDGTATREYIGSAGRYSELTLCTQDTLNVTDINVGVVCFRHVEARSVTLRITDASGLPVAGSVSVIGRKGKRSVARAFCGASAPIWLEPDWQTLRVDVGGPLEAAFWCELRGIVGGPATQGVVRATFHG